MNIQVELEKDHTRSHGLKIANYACISSLNFKKLMACFWDSNHRIAQKAAWCVSWAAKSKKGFSESYISDFIEQVIKPNNEDAIVRNSLRILELLEIPEDFHGILMNACFSFVENPSTAIAIKAFSLTILFNLSKTYPEIQDELICIIEENWDHETPAFKSRGKKIISFINKSRKMI
jgi:hypothetical protein